MIIQKPAIIAPPSETPEEVAQRTAIYTAMTAMAASNDPIIGVVAKMIYEYATPLKPGIWNDDLNKWERADDGEKRLCRMQAACAVMAIQSAMDSVEQAQNPKPKLIVN